MSKTTVELPATELVERAIEIARVSSTNDKTRVWGALNDTYVREFPQTEDWSFLLASSALSTIAKYTTGTVSVNTGATTVTFSSDVVLTAAFTGRKIKFSNNANVYTLTYSTPTSATLDLGLSGDQNITSGSYTIFQPVYALASTFDRFPKNGGLQLWQGGAPTPVPETPIQTYYGEYTASPTVPTQCRLVSPDTTGVPQVELVPPPDKVYMMPYDFLQRPAPLRETTAGTCTVVVNSTTASFQQGARLSVAGTGWFLRMEADGTGAHSEWYRVIAVSAANSSVTLQTAYAGASANSATYTLSAAPQMPPMMHDGLLYGTAMHLFMDQDDPQYAVVQSQYAGVIGQAKRLYKSRTYTTQVDTVMTDYLYRR